MQTNPQLNFEKKDTKLLLTNHGLTGTQKQTYAVFIVSVIVAVCHCTGYQMSGFHRRLKKFCASQHRSINKALIAYNSTFFLLKQEIVDVNRLTRSHTVFKVKAASLEMHFGIMYCKHPKAIWQLL